jgi:hypothetical protein
MLEQERGEMMPMTTAFDGYVEKSARVSSTCLVTVARNRYSAHQQDSCENLPLRQIPIVGAACGATLFMFYIT